MSLFALILLPLLLMPSVSHRPTWPSLSWPGLKEGVVVLPVLGVARHDPPLRGMLGLWLEVAHRLQHGQLVTMSAGQEGYVQRVDACLMLRCRVTLCDAVSARLCAVLNAVCGAFSEATAPQPGKETHQPLKMDRKGFSTHQFVQDHHSSPTGPMRSKLTYRRTQSAGGCCQFSNFKGVRSVASAPKRGNFAHGREKVRAPPRNLVGVAVRRGVLYREP